MKRLALLLVMALAFAVPSQAGWNIHQKDTGAAVWQNGDGDQVPVGDSGLTVLLEDVSTASTAYVVSHKSGNIVKIYSVMHGILTIADAALDFGVVSGSSASVVTQVSGGVTLTLATTGPAGEVDSIAFRPNGTGANATSNLTVNQGDAIYIHTDGASTTDVDATITIVIE